MSLTTHLSRRAFLRPSTAPSRPEEVRITAASGLNPYAGPWTAQEAGHLLSRATFGATFATLREAVNLGAEGTLDKLLADLPAPPAPVAQEEDGITPEGESWTNYAYPTGAAAINQAQGVRRRSLWAWINRLRTEEGISARETMVLFWHNHFAINHVNEPRWNYMHQQLLRRQAFGNFRELVKEVTIDPLMLAFLDGSSNTARAPNENYARELLELFTVGKGPQVGPGDYTNFTEDDVIAMAKSLTGWRNVWYRQRLTETDLTPVFVPNRHDDSTVTLSHRFDGQQVPSTGAETYADLIDIILAKDAVASFIVRKLYRWFVYYEIDEQVEQQIIQPLATQLREGDYAIKPVLRRLLGSDHFFDVLSQGPMIKHPVRAVLGTLRQLEVQPNNPNRLEDYYYLAMHWRSDEIGMSDFRPPNVAGWKAFYQEPLFYRQWVNSATLPLRKRISDHLFANNSRLQGYGRVTFSLLEQVKQFPQPGELWPMINEWVSLLFPRPLPESQLAFIKNILLPGLPDTQWAVEYADYLANPNDEAIAQALETNLRRMVKSMLEMPEFQLG